MSDFPEPRQFNGSREETGGYIGRPTGPRRDRPGVCPVCGDEVPDRPFFGDTTCGRDECRDAAVRR